jgi:hypothetical protein
MVAGVTRIQSRLDFQQGLKYKILVLLKPSFVGQMDLTE